MDLDLRKLRYFVAVAEELHFGRAAARLHIAQPALSRQIRALEDELKTVLFLRDRRGTVLTPAGEQLLDDARGLLSAADAVRRRLAAAAKPVLTVGFMPGIVVTPAVRVLARREPDLTVRLLRTSWHDQVEVLHDGRVDVGVVRLPFDRRGLTVRPLFEEPRVVTVPAGHRLAGKESVSVTELADEHLLQDPDAVPEWRDIAVELRGAERAEVPPIHSVEEKLELVAAEAGISIIPASTAAFYTRPDVVAVPVADIAPNRVCLAWLASRRSGSIEAFVEAAATLIPHES
ncbi:DNA-binding transcriptional regulator, LysR family [Amycolatopsis pretoriensis]|uniref:DNA-binding transcriptional regulator, LysR family n=1 Tax=Amycolatopsis pretoriensis TaxID=218821 RepID=A0A1H5QD46_9PSEU|nr:LysR family transcriptional regulator [Amycolatopsis pretoriensis]SEF23995.1 DNA-binding transcriptional regulator, LysR family [Amycolatopsis pretoriensis]